MHINNYDLRSKRTHRKKIVDPFGEEIVSENGQILNGHYRHKNIYKYILFEDTRNRESIKL